MFREMKQLVLGRGEVYFDRFLDGTLSGEGERYIGNTPSFQITRTIRRHKRSRSYHGAVHELPGAILSEEVELDITTDQISWENISDWFSTTPSEAGITGDEFIPFVEQLTVRQGRYYQLGKQLHPLGATQIDSISGIKSHGGNTFRDGIDWYVDRDAGRIYIPIGSERIPDNSLIDVTYLKRNSGMLVAPSAAKNILGAIRYLSKNPHGPKTDYFVPMARLSPNGGYNQKGDQFQQMRFSATVLRRTPSEAMLYAFRPGIPPVPITADTTLITADTTQYRADNGAWENA